MKDDEFPVFNYCAFFTTNQSVIEKLRLTIGCMNELARRANDLEIWIDFVFTKNEEFLADAIQALEPLEDDVPHPVNMDRPLLPCLFDSCVRCPTSHKNGGVKLSRAKGEG